jgi:hypothetical protein
MLTWTVTAHTPLANGYVIGGCVEIAERLYVLVACPDTRTLGEFGVDVQARYDDGKTLMWIDVHVEPHVVVKTLGAPQPGTDRLTVTVRADAVFVARAVIVPNHVEVSVLDPGPPQAGIAGQLSGPHPRLVERS